MRKFILLFALLGFYLSSLGQLPLIKKEVSQLFFNLPLSATRFEIRSLLNSNNNFYNVDNMHDYTNSISAKFRQNFKMSYLGFDNFIYFGFEGSEQNCNYRSLTLKYSETDFEKCYKQYKELITFFRKNSYTSDVANTSKDNSEVRNFGSTRFYLDEKSWREKKFYLKIEYRFIDYLSFGQRYNANHVNIYMLDFFLEESLLK